MAQLAPPRRIQPARPAPTPHSHATTAPNVTPTRLPANRGLANSALGGLHPTAQALAPGERASRTLFRQTTAVLQRQIGPFARAAQPTVAALAPAARTLAAATPNLTTSLAVLSTFLNDLAYNREPDSNPGYLFYLAWAGHDLNGALSSGDANGALPRAEALLAPSSAFLICAGARANPTLGVVVNQLHLPFCASSTSAGGLALSARPPSTAARAADGQFNSTRRQKIR